MMIIFLLIVIYKANILPISWRPNTLVNRAIDLVQSENYYWKIPPEMLASFTNSMKHLMPRVLSLEHPDSVSLFFFTSTSSFTHLYYYYYYVLVHLFSWVRFAVKQEIRNRIQVKWKAIQKEHKFCVWKNNPKLHCTLWSRLVSANLNYFIVSPLSLTRYSLQI